LIALLRLGFVKLKYFPYAISNGRNSYLMLGRPTTTSAADFFVLREVLVDETYRDVLPLLPQKALRVVDIGANLGSFTIWLNQTAKVDEAFCFEPEPDSFRLLRFNLANNRCGFAHALDKIWRTHRLRQHNLDPELVDERARERDAHIREAYRTRHGHVDD